MMAFTTRSYLRGILALPRGMARLGFAKGKLGLGALEKTLQATGYENEPDFQLSHVVSPRFLIVSPQPKALRSLPRQKTPQEIYRRKENKNRDTNMRVLKRELLNDSVQLPLKFLAYYLSSKKYTDSAPTDFQSRLLLRGAGALLHRLREPSDHDRFELHRHSSLRAVPLRHGEHKERHRDDPRDPVPLLRRRDHLHRLQRVKRGAGGAAPAGREGVLLRAGTSRFAI